MYVCSNCGEEYLQWQGRCANCGEWNTLKEISVPNSVASPRRTGYTGAQAVKTIRLSEVSGSKTVRVRSGFAEIDRVLGGGIVSGSVILLGGDPGIGKSTLLLQLIERLAKTEDVLYVSGEESPEQIRLRAERLGTLSPHIQLLAATDVDVILHTIETTKPVFCVIDSIQTMYDAAYPSTPGSIVQVRETALKLQASAKRLGIPLVLVGHITKEGTIAGPRTLEHLVDVVLYLEGESERSLRLLRAAKNRFGDVSEVGIFAMEEQGMVEVPDPGRFLLSERIAAPGSVLTAVLEGTRPMLIEVQALTTPTVFGNPRRTASGFDLNRLNLLLAVLQKRAGVNLSSQDVFVNVVGGLKVRDPAVDAAVCTALASAYADKTVAEGVCVIGEVGLSGELRRVTGEARRIKEIRGLGYDVPEGIKSIRQLIAQTVGLP